MLELGACFTGVAPAGHSQANWADLCASYKASGYFDQPMCQSVPRPAIPSCLDAASQRSLAYCQQYGSNGPDGAMNALCWAGRKDAAWWATFMRTPPCGAGGTDRGGGGDGQAPIDNTTTAWIVGGVAVLAAAGLGWWLWSSQKGRA